MKESRLVVVRDCFYLLPANNTQSSSWLVLLLVNGVSLQELVSEKALSLQWVLARCFTKFVTLLYSQLGKRFRNREGNLVTIFFLFSQGNTFRLVPASFQHSRGVKMRLFLVNGKLKSTAIYLLEHSILQSFVCVKF